MRFSERHRFVFVESLREVVNELADVFIEVVVSIVWHAADAPRVTRQAGAKLSFEDLQNLFAFDAAPHSSTVTGADIERVRREPEQVRSDAIELRENRAAGNAARGGTGQSPSSVRQFPPTPEPFDTAAM
jgi:hypothetical protein